MAQTRLHWPRKSSQNSVGYRVDVSTRERIAVAPVQKQVTSKDLNKIFSHAFDPIVVDWELFGLEGVQ